MMLKLMRQNRLFRFELKFQSMFKHHRYPKFIILQAVYFKFRFTLSYRDIEELMKIRGVKVDHSTIQKMGV